MREEFVNDVALRRFLLGDVDDDERQRIESLFISDAEANTRILTAEDDLFEDYLENTLTASDRDKFLLQYGRTPQQRRRLRIDGSIKKYAVAEARSQTAVANRPKRRTWSLGLHNRVFYIPVAATLVIGLVIAAFWVVRWNAARDQENNRHLAIERELSDLNTPANLRENPPKLISMVLPPVSFRSMEVRPELNPQSDIRLVELRLMWTQKEQYESYRAVIHQVGKSEEFTVSNLHVEKNASGSVVRLRVPVYRLVRGLYQLTLSGIANNGAPDLSEEFSFNVGN